jgi:hypothetical protein
MNSSFKLFVIVVALASVSGFPYPQGSAESSEIFNEDFKKCIMMTFLEHHDEFNVSLIKKVHKKFFQLKFSTGFQK